MTMHTHDRAGRRAPSPADLFLGLASFARTGLAPGALVFSLIVAPAGCDPDEDGGDDAADTGSHETGEDDHDHGSDHGDHGDHGEEHDGGSETAHSDDSDDGSGEGIEIAGVWLETYRGGMVTHTIDDMTWESNDARFGATTLTLDSFDNATRTAIGDSGMGFSKLQWTWTDDDTQLWYCTAAFAQETAEDAAAAADADASDPANGGCGDFAWSMLAAG
ncbi:MAG: hypothetical protein AAF721_30235 [Myxococcota bacterium]